MAHRIVCTVRFDEQKDELEFTSSEDAPTFKPYTRGRLQVDGFRRNAQRARGCLQDLVALHRPPKDDRDQAAIGRTCLELGRAGYHLYNLIFDGSQETAEDVRQWLQGIT